MPFGWPTKSSASPIGIDFGADTLKLLQLLPGDPPSLLTAVSIPVPDSARTDPALRTAFFADSLKNILKQHRFKGKNAILAIPAYQTLMQQIQLSRSDDEDPNLQIEQHLRQRLNVEPLRMVIRHFIVGQVVRDGATKDEAVCLAAGREAVMRHIDIVTHAGLDVVGMECEPQALLRAFAHLHRRADDKDRTLCFIDIGAATTKVVISHGGELAFAKNIHAAGDHLTRQFASASNIDFTQAKQRRRQSPSAPAPTSSAPATQSATPSTGMAVLEAAIAAQNPSALSDKTTTPVTPKSVSRPEAESDVLDCLIDELQLCLRYHQSVFPNRAIDKLVFLGGEACQTSICQKIARSLHIGAQLGDPFTRLVRTTNDAHLHGLDLHQPQPGWAIPLGLCLTAPTLAA